MIFSASYSRLLRNHPCGVLRSFRSLLGLEKLKKLLKSMNQRDLLSGVNPFCLSMREQMYNCLKWLANSLKAGSAAPVGRYKVAPTGVISPQKYGRWHFENAVGRENPAKSRPMDSILRLHRARCRFTMCCCGERRPAIYP